MLTSYRFLALTSALVVLIGLSGCGSGGDSISAGASTTAPDEEHLDHDDEQADHDDEQADHDDDHSDEASAGLGAHEHGVAELTVAWIDADVAIDLISPTYNIFGFEYEPSTDEDVALVEDRTEALTAPGIITINAEAGCSLTEPVATELEFEGSHSEMTVSWLFACEEPDEISQLDATRLFTEFPNFQDIDAQWISASDQSAAELTPTAPTLRLQE